MRPSRHEFQEMMRHLEKYPLTGQGAEQDFLTDFWRNKGGIATLPRQYNCHVLEWRDQSTIRVLVDRAGRATWCTWGNTRQTECFEFAGDAGGQGGTLPSNMGCIEGAGESNRRGNPREPYETKAGPGQASTMYVEQGRADQASPTSAGLHSSHEEEGRG